MMKIKLLTFFGVLSHMALASGNQPSWSPVKLLKGPKTYYASWGYHRNWYSTSDINLRMGLGKRYVERPDYTNLIIQNARANDRPDFDKIHNLSTLTVPQFNARIGFVADYSGWGFELSYDHAKYVVKDYQTLHVSGYLNGKSLDTQMLIDPATFLHLEHTDGANFWMCNFTKTISVTSPVRKIRIRNMSKIGGGAVVPRTDVTFLGKRIDHNFHLAGYVLGIENAILLHIRKHFYTELSGKYAFAYITNALLNKSQNMYITQRFHTLMAFVNIGYCF